MTCAWSHATVYELVVRYTSGDHARTWDGLCGWLTGYEEGVEVTFLPDVGRYVTTSVDGEPDDVWFHTEPGQEYLNWHIRQVRADEAWELIEGGRAGAGKGVLVGHLDSGYQIHPALGFTMDEPVDTGEDTSQVLASHGHDFFTGQRPTALGEESSHGLSTGSMIVGLEHGPWVPGIAPGARLIPFRVMRRDPFEIHEAVITGDPEKRNVAEAIVKAVDEGCHVISMSLGIPFRPGQMMRRAVEYAHERDVILVAASSNIWPFVTYPARFPLVIACAGTTRNGTRWFHSGRGPAVDIAAPGHDVQHAARSSGDRSSMVDRNYGTSFATGRKTAQRWPSSRVLGRYGQGILDARTVLEYDLPTPDDVAQDSRASAAGDAFFDQVDYYDLVLDVPDDIPTQRWAIVMDKLGLDPAGSALDRLLADEVVGLISGGGYSELRATFMRLHYQDIDAMRQGIGGHWDRFVSVLGGVASERLKARIS